MRTSIAIRPEKETDYPAIDALILRAFREGTDYSDGSDVVAFLHEIRASRYYIGALSFVSEMAGEIVGSFLFSRFPLSPAPCGDRGENESCEVLLLAPVAVHADHFRQGIGTDMLTLGVKTAKRAGYKGILVEGDYRYYNRFGFRTSAEYGIHATSGLPLDEPRYMMCMETYPDSLRGITGYVVFDMYQNA